MSSKEPRYCENSIAEVHNASDPKLQKRDETRKAEDSRPNGGNNGKMG
jgi:hypothetical protein